MMKLSFGKKLMLAATMAVLVSGGVAVCNTVQTEAASSKASGFTYENGAMRFSQLVNMGSINSNIGGPRPYHKWSGGDARISGDNVIIGSGPLAYVFHTRPYPGQSRNSNYYMPSITNLSTASGIEIAKFKQREVENVSIARIDTNKNLTLFIERYTRHEADNSNLFIRGITKDGKVYTYIDCHKILGQYYNTYRKQILYGYRYPNPTYKQQGNTLYIPFEIGYLEGYHPENIKGTLVLEWNESANWFSYRIQ